MNRSPRARIGRWLLGPGLVLALLAGCTHSSLYVESEPPGAQIFFDGKPKGVTPEQFDFQWYGSHKLKLRKAGYEELNVIEKLRAPLHYKVPLDFVTTVIPAKISDRQKRSYTLTPQPQGQVRESPDS